MKKRVKKLNMDLVSFGFSKSQKPELLNLVEQNSFTLAQE